MIRFQMVFMKAAPGLKEIPPDPWSDPTIWFVEDESFERVLLDAETREDAISESDAHWARHQEQPLELQAYGYIVADFERDIIPPHAVVRFLNTRRG